MARGLILLLLTITAAVAGGCAPEVGSERWCNAMGEKPKADWTAREATDYTKHCVFR